MKVVAQGCRGSVTLSTSTDGLTHECNGGRRDTIAKTRTNVCSPHSHSPIPHQQKHVGNRDKQYLSGMAVT